MITTHATMRGIVLVLSMLILLAAPGIACAGTYWWTGTPVPGSNGFSWTSADQPYWNPWQGTARCETRGTTIPAGNPCVLTWSVPSGLDARGGWLAGTYKHANPAFEQRMVVECNGTTTLQGTATITAFRRQWSDVCNRVAIELLVPAAPTAVAAASQFFNAESFSIELVDDSAPRVAALDAASGWHGAGGACIRWAFTEAGSGIESATLWNVGTGQVLDSVSYDASGIVTGVGVLDRRSCFTPPGSGTWPIRARAVDRSGNAVQQDTSITFDVTNPVIGEVDVEGVPIGGDDEVTVRGSDDAQYRPLVSFAASDAHSGLASTSVELDGVQVAHEAQWRSPDALTLGRHVVRLHAVDQVGNVATRTITLVVVDDVPPLLQVDAPEGEGDHEPVLDVRASDDASGVDAPTWTVHVNGRPLAVGSSSWRLLAEVGYLVAGEHELRVRVSDRAGNVAEHVVSYHVLPSDATSAVLPALTGLFVLRSFDRAEEGSVQHVRVIGASAGRPITGRYELRRAGRVLAAVDAERSGIADFDVRIDAPGPIVVHAPEGSGLEQRTIEYEFVPAPEPVPAHAPDPAPAPAPAPIEASSSGGGSVSTHDVVYYVNGVPYWNGIPLAESGAALDRVPPRWRITVRRERAGSVRRTSRLALRAWTSELSVLSLTPQGAARRFSATPRQHQRTIHVRIARRSALGRRIRRAHPGQVIVVRLRVVVTDRNGNAAAPRTLRLRVRV